MDLVIDPLDKWVMEPFVYPATWKASDPLRQSCSLFLILTVGGALMYLSAAYLSWCLWFDRRLLKHKKILPNQVSREIWTSLSNIPMMSVPTVLMVLPELNGYSRLYDRVDEYGWGYFFFSWIFFILFTDCFIYWIHRWLHLPAIYARIHKPHHQWLVSTPFASHAFHWFDGFAQSSPYHIFPYLFPLHKGLYLCLFIFVNFWTVSIHDGVYLVPESLKWLVNGAAHHTDHHLYFTYNYGQFLTIWDRIGGSYRWPSPYSEGGGPLDEVERMEEKKKRVGEKGEEEAKTGEGRREGLRVRAGRSHAPASQQKQKAG
uniref:Fatty acid hydroxylase domain-containing protein n=1 Tax=Chromera velia CCMP2878 TaxID=1169474 RepID=A0A0G4IE88_9ALVE|eukprot:Cvel_2367.t1-p1 / transcript=Cvel_2367.t1 / gene=Cvel_2367 / organism=Chromera_velia_CCMP2878 / gene_product=Lathosterol oxidase, putative / transcript_product=Lathosterol oxidase, putative / location=Cvel_scaffold92:21712-22656(+) / protein_length=315 / sequence_SO=supercontig / SO=protein_coding / is_pseudo=false